MVLSVDEIIFFHSKTGKTIKFINIALIFYKYK